MLKKLRTDLGNPSSASGVTGADAFSKIATLNADLSDINNKFPTYSNAANFNSFGTPITPTIDQTIIFIVTGTGEIAITVSIHNNSEMVACAKVDNEYVSLPFYARKGVTYTVNATGTVSARIVV